MNRININKIQEKDYLYNSCNLYYDKYFNSDDKGQLKFFEREIWMISSEIIDNIKRKKIEKKNLTDTLSEELLKIIVEDRFGRGRESFVMLLHYFKNNSNIETCLATLLDDEQLYPFAIDELTILKNFNYVDKVQKILSKEKVPWRRKVAERYIKKYLDSVFQ